MGYFFKIGSRKDGPISGSTIKRYIAEGRIIKGTPLCKEGTDRWVLAGNVPALRSIFRLQSIVHADEPLAIPAIHTPDPPKPLLSVFVQAVVIIVLYNVFFFPGLIVNAYWFWQARETKKRTGVAPAGFSFLRWMLIVNGAFLVIGAIFYFYNPFQKNIDELYSIIDQLPR